MRVVLSFLLWCLVSLQPAWATSVPPSPEDIQYGEWMTYYYMEEDTSEVESFLHWIEESSLLERNGDAEDVFAAFVSVLFADNPKQVPGWVKGTPFSGEAKAMIGRALWLSGNGALITEICKETPSYANASPLPLLARTAKQPGDLSKMWSAFFASGNTAYISKVIDVLDESAPLTGDKTRDATIRDYAEWSLGSNITQHELVERTIRKEAKKRQGTAKKRLEKIITHIEKGRQPYPNHDGDFSVMLMVVDDAGLEEFKKPSYGTRVFHSLGRVKVDVPLALKIVFTGMALTDDLQADVTYDMKLVNPDGTISKTSGFKGAKALQGKKPARFIHYQNRSFPKIIFEPQDKLGKYRMEVTIHDNIGKKKIALTHEIELIR